ncbi:MAG: NAD-dependent epimerase/dehydratase family protein [Nitrososphaerota archaeon]|nr:NAD-dependent epimerase/dehydratase family protein [Nitrososphaerota archaeon]
MNLIVTGGAGFIGSHLTKYLIKKGHSVSVIDSLRRGSFENLREIKDQIDFQEIDILDYEKMKNIAKNADGIFHQAALGSIPQSFKEPEEYHRVNAIGTENVLKLAKEFGFKVVYASSSSVYGNQDKFPIKEDAEKKPLNPYGQSKLESEQFAKKYADDRVKVIGLRYFNVFGIGQNPNYAGVVPKFIERLVQNKPPIIYGHGNQLRNFTFVDDVVEANVLAFENKIEHAFMNIATGVMTSVKELAAIMIRLSGLSIEPTYEKARDGDIEKSQADISLAKNLINWVPKTTLEEGLEKIFPKIGS